MPSCASRPSETPRTRRSCSSTVRRPRCSGGRPDCAHESRAPAGSSSATTTGTPADPPATRPAGRPGYTFTDLAGDALGVLDALGVERAHIVCRSMAGGIGLILGVDHPDRVLSLTFASTSPGGDGLPPPSDELTGGSPADPDPADPVAVADFVVASAKALSGGSPFFDETATRALVERDVARTRDIASTLVNHYAMTFDGPSRGFGDIKAPTLVVHGDHDPLFPLPHGRALRDAIPGAELLVLEGAGHDLPRPLWDVFVPALVRHTGGGRP